MNRRRFLMAALGVAGAALVPIPIPTVEASLRQLTPDQVRRRLDRRLRSGLRQRLEATANISLRGETFGRAQVRDLIEEINHACGTGGDGGDR